MHWQDYVLTLGSIVFVIALIPSVRNKTAKPAISTSLTTSVVLFVFVLVYLTLALWSTAFTTSLSAITWLVLAIQRHRLDQATLTKINPSNALLL